MVDSQKKLIDPLQAQLEALPDIQQDIDALTPLAAEHFQDLATSIESSDIVLQGLKDGEKILKSAKEDREFPLPRNLRAGFFS